MRQFGFDHNGALDDDDVSKLLHGNRGLIVIMIMISKIGGSGRVDLRPQPEQLFQFYKHFLQALLQELILSGCTGKT